MDGRHVVAEGTEAGGLAWTVWVRRDEPRAGDLLTMVRVRDVGGRILHADGTSGPPLPSGHLLHVSTGGSSEGPRVLWARLAPPVRRLELAPEKGAMIRVPIYDCAAVPEVRFAAILLHRNLPLAWIAGYGVAGDELERFDLRFHQAQWERRHPLALAAPWAMARVVPAAACCG